MISFTIIVTLGDAIAWYLRFTKIYRRPRLPEKASSGAIRWMRTFPDLCNVTVSRFASICYIRDFLMTFPGERHRLLLRPQCKSATLSSFGKDTWYLNVTFVRSFNLSCRLFLDRFTSTRSRKTCSQTLFSFISAVPTLICARHMVQQADNPDLHVPWDFA